MEIDFSSPFGEKYDWLEQRYTTLAETAFSLLNIEVNYEVDVSLVDDETIHEINRSYRKVDRVTDVISFAFNDDKNPKDAIASPKVPRLLRRDSDLPCLKLSGRQKKLGTVRGKGA
jgi:ssRNA-specific RNase YbeY (16S rRNA maturation enzyme)